jgi:hypothetical protein
MLQDVQLVMLAPILVVLPYAVILLMPAAESIAFVTDSSYYPCSTTSRTLCMWHLICCQASGSTDLVDSDIISVYQYVQPRRIAGGQSMVRTEFRVFYASSEQALFWLELMDARVFAD